MYILRYVCVQFCCVLCCYKRHLQLKNAIFWDVAPFCSCRNGRLGGIFILQHQGENNNRGMNNDSSN
jgi:hypothetical protein